VSIQSAGELRGLREAGRIAGACLRAMAGAVRPGITTAALDDVGAKVMRRHGARSAPKLVYGFPGESCISVNDEIVHGVPGGRRLVEGDVVKLDVTMEKDGLMADTAMSVPVGRVGPGILAMIACAERAFGRAVRVATAGGTVRDIGRQVEAEARRSGFAVVRDLTGHGIGRTIHEEPIVPNFDDPQAVAPLTRGLVIAVEPLISMGSGVPFTASDGWTVRTVDRAPAAHFEHTMVITQGSPILLTDVR